MGTIDRSPFFDTALSEFLNNLAQFLLGEILLPFPVWTEYKHFTYCPALRHIMEYYNSLVKYTACKMAPA